VTVNLGGSLDAVGPASGSGIVPSPLSLVTSLFLGRIRGDVSGLLCTGPDSVPRASDGRLNVGEYVTLACAAKLVPSFTAELSRRFSRRATTHIWFWFVAMSCVACCDIGDTFVFGIACDDQRASAVLVASSSLTMNSLFSLYWATA
jgi:hypothetical protein